MRICAATGDPLYVVESESSVDALNKAGHYAVTWPGGAAAPPLTKLAGVLAALSDVRVVADHDESGIRCARTILTSVRHATGWLAARALGVTSATYSPPPRPWPQCSPLPNGDRHDRARL